jgi:GNAT superfamily N-acetyltransferase
MVSVMTARPVHITILKGAKDGEDAVFDAYYVDYLCVDKFHRKKGIAPQMIQTHHYNQRHLNKNICVSLFKREEELTGIVPLCVYSTYGFSVNKWTKPPDLHPMYRWLEINEQTYHFLHDFMKETNHYFDIVIASDSSNILEVIKTKNIFIWAVLLENEIIAAYFYRKTCVFIEKGMEVLSCIGSINNCNNDDLFIQGFKVSFWKIAADNYFGFAAIEDISHNHTIIQNIKKKTTPLIVSPTAYFFYNFIYSTFHANRVFILN